MPPTMHPQTIKGFNMLRLLALCLLCFVLGRSAAAQPVTVTVWHPFNAEETVVFRQIVQEFETNSAGKVKIDLQYVSFGDMFTKLRTAALARMTPDIAFMDSIKVTDLAFGRGLLPVSDLEGFKKRYGTIDDARRQFVPASFNAAVVNRIGEEKLYGLPVQTTTIALFWNKAMFRSKADKLTAAGLDPNRPPKDWGEMEAYGKVLTDPEKGVYAFGMSGSMWFNFAFFNMYQMEWVKYAENGLASPAVNSPRGKAALARLQRLSRGGIEGGAWKRSALSPEAGFLNEKYAMVMTGPWNVENYRASGLDFGIAMNPAPTPEEVAALGLTPPEGFAPTDPGAFSSSNVGGQSGVIMRLSQHPNEAYEFLEYFTSEPVQRRWASALGQIPTRRTAWKDLDISKFPYMRTFMDQLAVARRIPGIPLYGILETDVYNPQVDLLLQGSQTPDQMLEKMEAAMNRKIFRRMNEAIEGMGEAKK